MNTRDTTAIPPRVSSGISGLISPQKADAVAMPMRGKFVDKSTGRRALGKLLPRESARIIGADHLGDNADFDQSRRMVRIKTGASGCRLPEC